MILPMLIISALAGRTAMSMLGGSVYGGTGTIGGGVTSTAPTGGTPSYPKPNTAGQQLVAAATHTSTTPVHHQTAQQRAVTVDLGMNAKPGRTGRTGAGFYAV